MWVVKLLSQDKHESFLQDDGITLGEHSQACPKYPSNKFAKNAKDEVEFVPTDKHQSFLEIDTIILGVCGQAFPKYQFPKNSQITSLLFFCNIL